MGLAVVIEEKHINREKFKDILIGFFNHYDRLTNEPALIDHIAESSRKSMYEKNFSY